MSLVSCAGCAAPAETVAVLGQAWSECVDSQRAGGQDFTEECAERTGALQARALRQPQLPSMLGRRSPRAHC